VLLQNFYVAKIIVSSSSVVPRAFSALCVYWNFRHHPHPLGYLCVKFRFFAPSVAELAHGEKSLIQLPNHSPSLFDASGTESSMAIYPFIRLISWNFDHSFFLLSLAAVVWVSVAD